MLSRIVIALIKFYQKALSPLKMPSCRFFPSCSEYVKQAVKTKGVVRGSLLGVYRILRCNPFCRGGYDPVPGIDDDESLSGVENNSTTGDATTGNVD